MANVRELPFNEKVEYFKKIFTDMGNTNEVDALNIYRIINSYNTFDDNFFDNENSYITDIAEFIDLKVHLEKEINELMLQLVTWYLSILASCEIPLTVEDAEDENKETIPPMLYVLLAMATLPLMASLLKKVDKSKIDLNNLHDAKNGFMLVNRMFQQHALVGQFLENM